MGDQALLSRVLSEFEELLVCWFIYCISGNGLKGQEKKCKKRKHPKCIQ